MNLPLPTKLRTALLWIRRVFRPEEVLLALTCLMVFGWLLLIQQAGWGDSSEYLSIRRVLGLIKWHTLEASLFLPVIAAMLILKFGWQMASKRSLRAVKLKQGATAGFEVARDFLPFVLIIGVYWIATEATQVFVIWHADPHLLKMEEQMFGGHVFIDFRIWLDQSWIANVFEFFSYSVNEFIVMCYGSYYIVPAVLAALIYGFKKRELFRRFILAFVLCSMIGYVGYNLVPVRGPKYVYPEIYADKLMPVIDLPENASFMGKVSEVTRYTYDCFPSLHTAMTLIIIFAVFCFSRWLFALYLPVGIGVIVATIYLGEHYVPDLFAGVIVAVVSWIWARKLEAIWTPRKSSGDDVEAEPVLADSKIEAAL